MLVLQCESLLISSLTSSGEEKWFGFSSIDPGPVVLRPCWLVLRENACHAHFCMKILQCGHVYTAVSCDWREQSDWSRRALSRKSGKNRFSKKKLGAFSNFNAQ